MVQLSESDLASQSYDPPQCSRCNGWDCERNNQMSTVCARLSIRPICVIRKRKTDTVTPQVRKNCRTTIHLYLRQDILSIKGY
ncbi:hypothetical protein BC937DRAFT_86131 [Endogone sp. FLAS-F59071]|nr:hypothetical protein BC937DRAFT_86131 [Endogone sp. FLAS-F59071]|eukprot:RUS23446.1 hypothetical protein BC937DRAFT_86131 [Endogone sp. FLAS-F59071]